MSESVEAAESGEPKKIVYVHLAEPGGDPSDDPDHVPTENERWYDEHIAPVLRELGSKCIERGMSLVAKVEIDRCSGMTGSTRYVAAGRPGFRFLLTLLADRSEANVDRLFTAIERYAKETNSTDASYYLNAMENYRKMLRSPGFARSDIFAKED